MARDSVDEKSYWEGEVDKTKKAFGGCEDCFGKGYSTQMDPRGSGTTNMNTCKCDRGKQLDIVIENMHKSTLKNFVYEMQQNLPEYIEEKYPKKSKSGKRGEAMVYIAELLVEVRKALKMKV